MQVKPVGQLVFEVTALSGMGQFDVKAREASR